MVWYNAGPAIMTCALHACLAFIAQPVRFAWHCSTRARGGAGRQKPMALHGVGPEPQQDLTYMLATIGLCHVQ